MAILEHLTLTNATVGILGLYLAYRAYWEATTGARWRSFAAQHGCKRPKQFTKWDPIFGLDFIITNVRHFRNHTGMEHFTREFEMQDVHTLDIKNIGPPAVMTVSPENIQSILATDFKNYSIGEGRIEFLLKWLGTGVFTTDGPEWKHSREMLRPNFERSQVADFSLFEKHFQAFSGKIPKDGETVNLYDLFHLLSMDIASEFLLGESTGGLSPSADQEKNVKFAKAFTYLGNPSQNGSPWGFLGDIFPFLPDPQFKRNAVYVNNFVDTYVDRAMERKLKGELTQEAIKDRYIFLEQVATQTDDRVRIRSEVLNVLLAGRDTTAALLTNYWWTLARHPEYVQKLREEIRAHLGDEQHPNWDDIKSMKYLRATINESLRLHTVVPSDSRQAIADTYIPTGGGPDGKDPIFVPKGAYVLYHLWGMHRRKDIYGEDANEFRPERWLQTEHPLRPGWGYLPFNGGPRVCIGQNFAIAEASYIIVRMLQEYEGLEARDNKPWQESLTLTCTNLNGCKVGLTPRAK